MADVVTEVSGRTLALSNLDKPLYPTGFTKGEVIDYYVRIAPVLLPHLARRPVTRVRFPHGTTHPSFFEKNVPNGAPDWLEHHLVTGSEGTVDFPVVSELPALVYLANLAALELHTPQWRHGPGTGETQVSDALAVDQLVVDLDPGPGIDLPTLATAALVVGAALAEHDLPGHAKTSGRKGLQVYVPLVPTPAGEALAYARALGARLTAAHPELFVTQIAKDARPGRILVDVNQNLPGRTTVAPYSLRGTDAPTVSAPVDWDEVEAATAGAPLRFDAHGVLARVAERGDLFADLLAPDHRATLPAASHP